MADIADIRTEAARLCAIFEDAGAVPVDCPILQQAETLLDLYGEDIRARTYVTRDPSRGEMMLRPDFTVPVVERHMAEGADPARYTYAGEVFRRQEDHPDRASEYIQVGFEIFDRAAPATADAEVFALIAGALAPLGLKAVTGDVGLLIAMVSALDLSEDRRAALMRHIWRPARFTALVKRFAGLTPVPPTRAALLARADPMASLAPLIGLRGEDEIAARIAALRADAEEPPLHAEAVALISAVLSVSETCPNALEQLRDIAVDMPAILPALERFEARCEALAAKGVAVESLQFEASFGRSSMEYYDGFVFGFYAEARPDLPPVATGGRYDALTRRLGRGREIPAVGGVIRPDMVLLLEAGS
ncbi:ATP phosphoribosyltransferase regulatory subunit [Marivita sp. GX14005]|uniref:ATP phosphoribosyltransferase regulatory subunit n=1 Tax=Marivita sp. GX14005 TaxID=2942276 RepID=UPI0020183ECC|nr:ATP phosphoribosyltransferase regulatory subunit [Marivita sp. GX14005]MCL3881043.1 ATP phosphoribosyltransferase regulatory subunit [Marivita sp. GX14005]